MKLTIFGATGNIGQQLLAQALKQDHQVTAFTRNPDKITRAHKNLKLIKGDVLDSSAVENALKDADVVVCALGMPLMSKDGLRAKGTEKIITAMNKFAGKRLVCLSAMGTGDSYELLPWHYKYLIAPTFMRHVYADHNNQEHLIENSNLDWVVVRPGSFDKKPEPTGTYQHGLGPAEKFSKAKISTGDVADFMLKQLTDDTYLHAAPTITY